VTDLRTRASAPGVIAANMMAAAGITSGRRAVMP
jgi:hypothetical protein